MAEEQNELQKINAEYQLSCTKAGHLQYQILALQQDLDTENAKMFELNKKAFQLQQDEAKLQAALAKAKAVEVPQTTSAGINDEPSKDA